jgi:hypothetical protein
MKLSRRPRVILFTAWLVAVAWLTLQPGNAAGPLSVDDFFCLGCSGRWGADAILNLVLFLPGGFLLVGLIGARSTILVALALTVAIETLQITLAGRHPSLADILTNTLGAAAGAAVASWPAGRLRAVAAMVAVAAWLAPALLLAPAPRDADLYALRNPDFPGSPVYPGQVLDARIGDLVLRGKLEDPDPVRASLRERATLHLEFVVAPEPARSTSLFGLYDGDQKENLRVAVRGDDVFVSWWSRATRFGLDQPEQVARGALAGTAAGDTVVLGMLHEGRRWCLDGPHGRDCDMSPGQSSGWALLLYPEGASRFAALAYSGLWAVLAGVLLGLALGGWRSAGVGGAVLAALGLGAAALAPDLLPDPRAALLLVIGAVLGGIPGTLLWPSHACSAGVNRRILRPFEKA